jgi:hypothetical protein
MTRDVRQMLSDSARLTLQRRFMRRAPAPIENP